MSVRNDAVLLRVFVDQEDSYAGRSAYRAIVARALEAGMAGATVFAGPEGFGRSRHVRSELNVDAKARTPMVVEIVDSEEQINRFLPIIHDMVESGFVTVEAVRAIYYRGRNRRASSAGF